MAGTHSAAWLAGLLKRQVGGRNQDRELLAPDDHAWKMGEVNAIWHFVFLTSFERAQPTEVDEHRAGHLGGSPDSGLRRVCSHGINAKSALRARSRHRLSVHAIRWGAVSVARPGQNGIQVR